MPRFSLHCLLLSLLLAAAPAPVRAQSLPAVESRLRPAVVLSGQPAILEVELDEGLIQNIPSPPTVDGLEIVQAGANRLIRDKKVRVVINYKVTPQRVGVFAIPPLPMRAPGRNLVAPGQSLAVVSEAEAGPPPPASRKVHCLLLAAKRDPYMGERIPVQLLVLADANVYLQGLDMPVLPRDSFATDRLENPLQGELTFAGRSWRSFAYPVRVTPLSAGKLQLGPATCHATVGVPDERGGGIFARMEQFRLPATSASVPLEVKPLPPGQPAGFTGAVGRFSVESTFDPAPQHAGDPVAVRLTVRGRGDPAQVTVPRMADESSWEVFEGSQDAPPAPSDWDSCAVDFRRILRPKGPPAAEVPPFEFSFFDPQAGRYETARSLPLPLPQTVATPVPAASPSPLPAALPPMVKLEPGSFIATVPPTARWRSSRDWLRPALWTAHAAGITLCLSLALLAFRRRYLASEEGRQAEARRQLKRRAETLARQNDESERLVQALRWVEDWQASPVARPLRPGEAEALAALGRRLDFVRYAPDATGPDTGLPDARTTLSQLLR